MYCWNDKKGECCFQDDMQTLYTKLKNAAILILATPIYIPMPGAMQNFLNRLCPLLEPELKTRDGRTRVRFRDDVNIHKIVLVATGGWWELANLDRLVLIVQEIAEDAGVEFAGALLRPHAHSMRSSGKVTLDGEAVLAAAKLAGHQLIVDGKMNPDTLTQISRPLVPQEQEPTQLNP
jgi:multimeric flavodoxin WrbA